jgi:hypothetical protein
MRGVLRVTDAVDRVLRLLEHTMEYGFKGREREALCLGVESGPIVLLAEVRGARKMRMAAKLLPHITVHADVVEEIVALKNTVLFHHPMILFRNEGLEDGGSDVGMVERSERISNVVQQRAGHVFVVAAVLLSEGSGEQRVIQAVHRKSTKVAVQELQMGDDALGKPLGIFHEVRADERPILAGGMFNAGEGCDPMLGHDGQSTQLPEKFTSH